MKRWTLPIALLVLGTLLAVVAGWGANTVLASAIGLGEGETLDKVGRPVPKAAQADVEQPTRDSVAPPRALNRKTRRQYVDAILARNIFDHTKVGVTAEDEPCEGEDCDGTRSDLPLVLLATLVAQPAQFSSALLFDENKKEAWGYGIGDKVMDAEIITIAKDRVVVKRGDGSQEFIEVGDAERPERTASSNRSATDDAEGIMKEGEDSYVVSRDLVDNALGNLDELAKMARARPHKDEDGNVDGFRLSGVRRNKLPYQLGIRSGDVVHSVNGQPLTNIQEAMNALNTMQNGSSFSFEISRRGERKTMSYNVR